VSAPAAAAAGCGMHGRHFLFFGVGGDAASAAEKQHGGAKVIAAARRVAADIRQTCGKTSARHFARRQRRSRWRRRRGIVTAMHRAWAASANKRDAATRQKQRQTRERNKRGGSGAAKAARRAGVSSMPASRRAHAFHPRQACLGFSITYHRCDFSLVNGMRRNGGGENKGIGVALANSASWAAFGWAENGVRRRLAGGSKTSNVASRRHLAMAMCGMVVAACGRRVSAWQRSRANGADISEISSAAGAHQARVGKRCSAGIKASALW